MNNREELLNYLSIELTNNRYDIENSNEYSKIYSLLDKIEDLEYNSDIGFEKSIINYYFDYGDELFLFADWDNDKYYLEIKEGDENNG